MAKSIAVLGDSIANGCSDEEGLGWIPRLSLLLNADNPNGYFFRNQAVPADRIYDVKYRLFGAIERNPDVLFIAVGVNDTQIFGNKENSMALSREVRCDLWRELLAFSKKNVPNIFVFGLLPANEARVPARFNDNGSPQIYRNDYISEYNKEIGRYCAEFGIQFVDFFDRFLSIGYTEFLADDVHPNAKGHKLIAEWAYEIVKGKL